MSVMQQLKYVVVVILGFTVFAVTAAAQKQTLRSSDFNVEILSLADRNMAGDRIQLLRINRLVEGFSKAALDAQQLKKLKGDIAALSEES